MPQEGFLEEVVFMLQTEEYKRIMLGEESTFYADGRVLAKALKQGGRNRMRPVWLQPGE